MNQVSVILLAYLGPLFSMLTVRGLGESPTFSSVCVCGVHEIWDKVQMLEVVAVDARGSERWGGNSGFVGAICTPPGKLELHSY